MHVSKIITRSRRFIETLAWPVPSFAHDKGGRKRTSVRSTGRSPNATADLGVSRSLIWINEPTKVFIARAGARELTTTVLSEDQVRDLVEKMLKSSGRRVDLSKPAD
jgi:hypothetical protein